MRHFIKVQALWLAILLASCVDTDGGGGSSGGDTATTGDDARRAVLADIGEDLILPGLQNFDQLATTLATAVSAWAAAPDDAAVRSSAQAAWRSAMSGWQRMEPLQVGPAGPSSGIDATPAGEDLRAEIYAFPLRNNCRVERAAADGLTVSDSTPVDAAGLAALEFLLFNTQANPCNLSDPATSQQRADYAASAANRVASVATELRNRWEPTEGNFLAAWSNAGIDTSVYARPQAALDALSVALFYVEKDSKDNKIAAPTGIGATGVTPCNTTSCPERLESRLSEHSGANLQANIQAFLDAFAGVGDGMGINDLLRGIGRDDLADEIEQELEDTLAHLPTVTPNFDTAVENISDRDACINASANPDGGGVPACALHGFLRRATDTFRGPIVGALSLATPDRAAGDND